MYGTISNKQKGAAAVEYVVLIIGVCLAIIVAVTTLGTATRDSFNFLHESLATPDKKCKDSDADSNCGIGND